MAELKWYESFQIWFRGKLCFILGHGFGYEPLPGDEPPFEFSHCQWCDKPNPNSSQN